MQARHRHRPPPLVRKSLRPCRASLSAHRIRSLETWRGSRLTSLSKKRPRAAANGRCDHIEETARGSGERPPLAQQAPADDRRSAAWAEEQLNRWSSRSNVEPSCGDLRLGANQVAFSAVGRRAPSRSASDAHPGGERPVTNWRGRVVVLEVGARPNRESRTSPAPEQNWASGHRTR
jgi:hypothetical protein